MRSIRLFLLLMGCLVVACRGARRVRGRVEREKSEIIQGLHLSRRLEESEAQSTNKSKIKEDGKNGKYQHQDEPSLVTGGTGGMGSNTTGNRVTAMKGSHMDASSSIYLPGSVGPTVLPASPGKSKGVLSAKATLSTKATRMSLTSDSKVPICKVDTDGFFIPPNDPRYIAPTTQIVESSDVTFGDAQDSLDQIDAFLGAISTVGEVVGTFEVLAQFATFAAGFGQVASIASSAIAILGPLLGLTSQDDILLDAIVQGFKQINSRLNTIQFELRAGFLELALFIGDVAMDELASRLTAHQRAFNAYANATDETRSVYEPRWRAICNAPFLAPEDIFYDLYGYVCDKCTFASRKRADLFDKTQESNPISGQNFFKTFADFILRGMLQAMTLHSLCLAPVEGSCADHQSDAQWNDGVANMQQSMDEAIQRIQATVSSLNDFVPKIVADHTAIDEIVKANSDNQEIANKILTFFTARQPEFFFQVLVYPPSDRSNYWRRSAVEPFATELQVTGHFHFENIEGRGISIRYRSRSLPPPSTTVTIGGQTGNFPEFHQMTIKRVGSIAESNAAVTDIDGGCTGLESGQSGGALACTVPHCFACSPDEQAAYDSNVGFFFVGRVDGFDVKEATDNIDSFPRYDAVFELTYSFATEFFPGTATTRDVFRFHFV